MRDTEVALSYRWSALQNVVQTLRSAVSGRPEGLHYICFSNAASAAERRHPS